MKTASSATQAILASGRYLKIELYKFVLPKAGSFFFTNFEVPVPFSGNTYGTGLSIVRSAFTQAVGLDVQSVDLTINPQSDHPGGAVTIGGAPFLSACRAGSFDGGIVTIYKGFFNLPASGTQLDLSPGFIPWFMGIVDEMQVGRFSVDITVNDISQILNVQMPKNILTAGCVHTTFDAGCTLSKATFTSTGSVVSVTGPNTITTSLTQADGYFSLGVLTFTSGVLNGSAFSVKLFTHTSGVIQTVIPFPTAPSSGDTYSILPGDDKTQATCTNKFSNLIHYRGAPYVPQPETLYDGGTTNAPVPTLGTQGKGPGTGSPFSGLKGVNTYAP